MNQILLKQARDPQKYLTIPTSRGMFIEKVNSLRRVLLTSAAALDEMRELVSASTTSIGKFEQLNRLIPRVYEANLTDVEARYNLATVDVLVRFFNGDQTEKITAEYYGLVNAEGCFSTLDVITMTASGIVECMRHACSLLKGKPGKRKAERKCGSSAGGATTCIASACTDQPADMSPEAANYELNTAARLAAVIAVVDSLARDIDRISRMDLQHPLETVAYDVCDCGANMTIRAESSELACPVCGISRPILGAVFSDDQFFPQEGQKTKHGDYAPKRHCRHWIERIFAEENNSGFIQHIPAITAEIKREGYCRVEITCENVRNILKRLGLTNLNEHVPSIIKLVGGIPPPIFTREERRRLELKFNRVIDLYSVVKPNNKNRRYYPYFMYKIVEWDYRDNPEYLRLLNYIHLQSEDTYVVNDADYEKICELFDSPADLTFIPTEATGGVMTLPVMPAQ